MHSCHEDGTFVTCVLQRVGQHRSVLEAAVNVPPLPDLLAVIGAAVTIVGGVIGLLAEGASTSRRSLENLALGTAIGGFVGCLIAFLVYLFVTLADM